MNPESQIDPNLHHSANLILLAISTFGAIITHITASGTAAFFTTCLAIVGILSYIHSFKVRKMEGEKYKLESEKIKLEIKELKIKETKEVKGKPTRGK